jgi:hypothetical protein
MGKFTSAIQESKIDIVPKTVVSMGADGQGINAFQMLLSLLVSEKLGVKFDNQVIQDEKVKEIKEAILKSMEKENNHLGETLEQTASSTENKD